MLYVGIRGVEPPGWAAAEKDVCGIALQDGQAQPQTWGAETGRSSSDCAAGAEKLCPCMVQRSAGAARRPSAGGGLWLKSSSAEGGCSREV